MRGVRVLLLFVALTGVWAQDNMGSMTGPGCDPIKTELTATFNRLGTASGSGSGSAAPTGCFDKNASPATIGSTYDCSKTECMLQVEKMLMTFHNQFMVGMCKADKPVEYDALMAMEKSLGTCNKCLGTYAQFKATQEQFDLNCKAAVGTEAICANPQCSSLATTIYTLWNQMITERQCQEYNPGSCGAVKSEEEGEVYNIVYPMSLGIKLYETIPLLCGTCKNDWINWYSQWAPLMENDKVDANEACLTTTALSTQPYYLAQSFLTIQLNCNRQAECSEKADALADTYRTFKKECTRGIAKIHKGNLVQAVDPRMCNSHAAEEDMSSWIFRYGPVAGYVILMALISLAILVVYFIVELCYNRIVRKRRGWDQVPNIFYWRSCVGAKKVQDHESTVRLTEQFGLDDEDDESRL